MTAPFSIAFAKMAQAIRDGRDAAAEDLFMQLMVEVVRELRSRNHLK